MRRAPKWLLDPLGPLSLRPAYALRILPWMVHFWRATAVSRHAAAVTAQSGLMKLSSQALERLIARVSVSYTHLTLPTSDLV